MKKKLPFTVLLIITILLSSSTLAFSNDFTYINNNDIETNDNAYTKRYIISYYSNKKNDAEFDNKLTDMVLYRQKLSSNLELIEFISSENRKSNIDEIRKNSTVRLIEEDYQRHMMGMVNDEYFSEQWSLDNIDATEAWTRVGTLQESVKVAVIDSGIEIQHLDLSGRIAPGGKGFLNGNIVDTINDTEGHGTAGAGVIAAQTENGIGIAGVAGTTSVYVLPLKIFWDSGSCYTSDIINALDYAISQNVDVINLSLGSTQYSQLEAEAIQRALNAGIVVVASAGNNGDLPTAGQYSYPASYDGVVSVGSISENNCVSYFSNYNDKVTVVAPGENILATSLNNTYENHSGTSFSAPIVSGIAAVLLGENPTNTPEQIKTSLESSATDLGDIGRDDFYGSGSVNFNNSLGENQMPDDSTGLIEELVFDREGVKILVELDGMSGYAYAYSTHNDLYQYLSGMTNNPIVYGLKSGSKYMEMGGINGYTF